MANNSVLLSVVVPAYNVREYIQECIDSVFPEKDHSEVFGKEMDIGIELILVDDGSTDGTGEICDRNAEQNSRIRVIHQKNSGVGAARNTGIREAKGKWILFVDSDDWVNMFVINEMLKTSEIDDHDMAAFSIEMERPDGSINNSSNSRVWYEYDMCRHRKTFQRLCLQNQMYWPDVVQDSFKYPIMTICVNKLFKKDFLIQNDILMKENIALLEDRMFNYECVVKAKSIIFYNSVAYHYRYRPSSAVHSDGLKMVTQMKKTIHCFYDIIGKNNKWILDGSFAYSCAQILWTLTDRLGKSSSTVGDLRKSSKELKSFMNDDIMKDTFRKIEISKVNKRKHRVVCRFLKHNNAFMPITICHLYYKIKS